MADIVERLRFDSARCEMHFSQGVAANIEEAAAEIARLREQLSHGMPAIEELTKEREMYRMRWLGSMTPEDAALIRAENARLLAALDIARTGLLKIERRCEEARAELTRAHEQAPRAMTPHEEELVQKALLASSEKVEK